MRGDQVNIKRVARLSVAPIILAGVALGIALGSAGSGEVGRTVAPKGALYAPGGAAETDEASFAKVERQLADRLTYPTGKFDQRWLLAAQKQAKLIKPGIPQGTYRPWRGLKGGRGIAALSASALSAARSLGPQPQESHGCQAPCFVFGMVSGRVSAIAFDPVNTSTAYIAQDGGGIWKTTNCCTPATSWTPTTDSPSIPTTAVDDVTVDPNNPQTVYAATGDISFGTFAFGSAGVLKSTNGGGSWTTLGASTFNGAYPATQGGSFPQYNAVTKIKVDPNSSQRLYAGTKIGMYFSRDGGTSWSGPCLTNKYSTQRQDVTDLIVRDDGTTSTAYVAIGARGYGTYVQQNLGKNGANGIYRLTKFPASGCPAAGDWTALTSGFPAGTASGIGCNPPLGDNVTMCTPTANKLGRIEMAMAPSDQKVLYAEVQAIDPQGSCGSLHLLGGPDNRGCFLGLWRTGNGGTTWTKVADHSTLDFAGGTATAGPCGEDTNQMWYDMGLAVDPNNPDAVFMDAVDIWKSTDGGQTLTDISCGYYVGLNPIGAPVHVDNHVLAYQPGSSTNLLAGNDGGVYVSNNAVNAPQGTLTGVNNPPTFKDVNASLNTIEFYGGDISQNFGSDPAPFVVAGAQDNGSSYYQFAGGSSCPAAGCVWSQRMGGDGFFARIEPKKGQRVFMETPEGGLNRSTTGPAGPYLGAAGPWDGERVSFIFPYEIDKFACPTTTCDHMVGGTYRVWESINGADSWYPNSPDLTKNTLADRSTINQLTYAPTNNGVALVGTNDGNVQYGFGLGTGTPLTANWVNVTGSNAVLPNRPVLDVAISPQNQLVGYAAVGGFDQNTPNRPGHVFQVTCSTFCASFAWANKTGNLPNIPVNSIAVNPNAPKQVFAGTDWGLYYTDNITLTKPVWNKFTNGLPSTMIWDMSIDRGATTLALFTRSRGAWAIALPTQSTTQVSFFSDDFETEKGWTAKAGTTCAWGKTTEAKSPSNAWKASYADACDTTLTSPAIAVPSTANTVRIAFAEKHISEEYPEPVGTTAAGCPCDYGRVQVSTDGGATFTSIGNFYMGVQPDYAQTTIPLPDSVAGKSVKLRFAFHADANTSIPPGGWWVDDVKVVGEPK
jgi:hypothetical protein